jgi:hypothetical protein
MTTTKSKPLSPRQAEALWSELRGVFVNAEKAILNIQENKAWEPLGFDTFAQAWDAKMRGVKLAVAAKNAVIYALIEDDLDNSQASQITGTPVPVVQRLREQKSNGIPSNLASTQVRSHFRAKPSAPVRLSVELPHDELANYKAMCEARGISMKDEALKAVRSHFRRLERIR